MTFRSDPEADPEAEESREAATTRKVLRRGTTAEMKPVRPTVKAEVAGMPELEPNLLVRTRRILIQRVDLDPAVVIPWVTRLPDPPTAPSAVEKRNLPATDRPGIDQAAGASRPALSAARASRPALAEKRGP